MATSNNSSSYSSPCAACKFLRRKCMPGCIFAPYFPPEEPQKFANVHKIFGASNVSKLLHELLPHQRDDAVSSLAYEAEARVRNPVYGCVGAITFLQRQVDKLQKELDAANADLVRFATCNEIITTTTTTTTTMMPHNPPLMGAHNGHRQNYEINRRTGNGGGGGGGGGFYPTPTFPFPYPLLPWPNNNSFPGDFGGGEANY
ncbi:hypothetical protein Leryth_006552 [Lithospermum erythrorhizon]|nr:hypothetical protein Leryth_006552 [Lithospermum erythrorhizon]